MVVVFSILATTNEADAECIYFQWTDSSGGNHYCPPDCGGKPHCDDDTDGEIGGSYSGGGYNQRQWKQRQEILHQKREAEERMHNRKEAP